MVQKTLLKQVYEAASWRLSGPGTAFLNYGFAPLDQPRQDLGLLRESEPDRFGIQLYLKVAGAVDLSGKEVLEVGCGRGGGTAFVFEHHHPKAITGLDLAKKAIAHCRAVHARPGLEFVTGDAENLPFAGLRSFEWESELSLPAELAARAVVFAARRSSR
jgi:fatty-acid O-methyltransferase